MTTANPSSALRKLLPMAVQNGVKLSATLKSTASKVENILKQSTDPSRDFPQILQYAQNFFYFSKQNEYAIKLLSLNSNSVYLPLRYFDERKNSRKLPMSNEIAQRLSRTQMMHQQLKNQADSSLASLKSYFNIGDFESTLKTAKDIIFLASGLNAPHQYLIEAYRCLALIHISNRRHDHAVNNVSQMINASRASGNIALFINSLVILGVVHVSFHHYDALSRAWQFLLPEVNDNLLPKAWLLHEIGRCHFECKRFTLALEFSIECEKISNRVNSKKWFCYAKLLCGQSLLKLGQFTEALEILKVAQVITKEVNDISTFGYIKKLINQVRGILKPTIDSGASIDSSRERSIERKILRDCQPFSGTLVDKMFIDNEITSSIKIEDEKTITTTCTNIVDCDLDSITSKNSDETYIIRKDQYQIPTRNFPFSSSHSAFSQQNQLLLQNNNNKVFHPQSGDYIFQHKVSIQDFKVSSTLENLSEIGDIGKNRFFVKSKQDI